MKSMGKKKVTVAFVCTALHEEGGTSKHIMGLYNNMSNNYRVLIVYCSREKDVVQKSFLDGGVKKEDLFHLSTSKEMLFIPLLLRLRKLFIVESVDIVHTFFLHSDILGCVAAFGAGVKRLISTVEGQIVLDEVHGVSKAKQLCYSIFNRMVRPHFYKTIAVSAQLKRELIQNHSGEEDKVEVFNIGIDIPSEEEINIDSRDDKKEKVIAAAARFSKDKQLEYLIKVIPDVVREVPQARFIIAGRGDEEKNLRQQADDLNVQSYVSFPGWIEDTKKLMREIDVLVITSLREGSPMALSEALSFSKSVVAFNVPGIKEVICSGEDGLLAEPFDLKQFSAFIIKVCKDREYAKMLGKNGRKKAEALLSSRMENKKLEALYAELLNAHP
jgi:glycosyltransferase involved in cell wall biosynthesis